MSDESQIVIPRPFIDLFIPKGAVKPNEPRAVIAERYELCEDLAQMLVEHASAKQVELDATARHVLDQLHQALLAAGSVVGEAEAGWVICRLAELLDWPIPEWARRG